MAVSHDPISSYSGTTGLPYTVSSSYSTAVTLLSNQKKFSPGVTTQSTTAAALSKMRLSGMYIYMNTISTAATLTVKVSRDAAGDEMVIPEFSMTITVGKTTATKGTCIGSLSSVCLAQPGDITSLYLWIKSDAGSCVVSEVGLPFLLGQ